MADEKLWTTFLKTGDVVDYLNYKGICKNSGNETVEDGALESINQSDRNDTVRNTNR
jgi:hypothetical protein